MADWEEELGLKNVRPFERPMSASPDDRMVAEDELGNKIYETITGQRYSIRPATADEARTTRAKVEDWVEEGAPLPSGEQVLDTLKNLPKAAYESLEGAVSGTGTVGDVVGLAAAPASPALVAGRNIDPSVVSAMGATHRVPSYKPKNELGQPSISKNITFEDPLTEILSEMEVPSQGLKGSQFLKELQDNPTIKNAQINAQGLSEKIDPLKRYSKEEIEQILEGSGFSFFASPANRYRDYQRQYDLVDPETNYVEYPIQASPNYDQKPFRAESQHYGEDTVAHVRLSERQSADGGYVLIEELQSDLLQKGFMKPSKDWEEAKQHYLKQIEDPVRFHIFNKITKSDLEEHERLNKLPLTKWEEGYDKLLKDISQRSGQDVRTVNDVFLEATQMLPPALDNVATPPVAKTEETVRLGLQTAIAHAYNQGLTKVVIPPFEKIVEKRFSSESERAKALDPKSGFYATYVKGVQKVLRNMQDEFGDDIKISSRDLEYDPSKNEYDFNDPILEDDFVDEDSVPTPPPSSPEGLFFNERFRQQFTEQSEYFNYTGPRNFGRRSFNKINDIGNRIVNRAGASVREALGEDYSFYNAFRQATRELYPDVNFINALEEVANGSTFTQAIFKQILPKEKPQKPPNVVKQGTEIDFSGMVNKGLNLSRPKFAEGGMVENPSIDPVSGNPVPPGASPKEVRDDVPIMASEGEYVVPANVVRYLGLERLEKLVSKAKQELQRLDEEGRIGGKTDDDLPFELDELVGEDEEAVPSPPMMNEGGMVTGWNSIFDNQPQEAVDPITGLPLWLTAMQQQTQAAAPQTNTPAPVHPLPATTNFLQGTGDDKDRPQKELTGTAQRMQDWSPDDFNSYTNQRNRFGQGFARGIASMTPLGIVGGVAVGKFQRELDQRATEAMQGMVKSGKDLQGNPLSTNQLNQMKENLRKVGEEPLRTRPGSVARGILEDTGIVQPRNPDEPRRGLIDRAIDFITGRPTTPVTGPTAPTSPLVTPRTPTVTRASTAPSSASTKSGGSAAGKSLSKSSSGGSDRDSGGSKSGAGGKSTAGSTKSTSTQSKSTSSSSKSSSSTSSSGGQKGSPSGGR